MTRILQTIGRDDLVSIVHIFVSKKNNFIKNIYKTHMEGFMKNIMLIGFCVMPALFGCTNLNRLNEASMGHRLNKVFSFTKWRDTKIDVETGETVPGDNTIEFYANSARLNGSYWKHPDGNYNYSGQILESQCSINLQGIAVRTKKSENSGFILEKQPDGTLQLRNTTAQHPFYKQ